MGGGRGAWGFRDSLWIREKGVRERIWGSLKIGPGTQEIYADYTKNMGSLLWIIYKLSSGIPLCGFGEEILETGTSSLGFRMQGLEGGLGHSFTQQRYPALQR